MALSWPTGARARTSPTWSRRAPTRTSCCASSSGRARTPTAAFLRCSDAANIADRTCYEANIFDQRKDPSYGTGAITHFAEVESTPKTGGKWNTYEITAKGREITVVLNGQKTAALRNALFAAGPIALQHAAGTIKFRKVAIQPL